MLKERRLNNVSPEKEGTSPPPAFDHKEVLYMLRKKMIRSFAATLGFVAFSAVLAFSSPKSGTSMSPDEALLKLMDGNKHYVENKLTNAMRSDSATRASLAKSQKPYAIILSCSDSRVPPEIIFDKGLGEIFVVRVAGNVPDPIVLGRRGRRGRS